MQTFSGMQRSLYDKKGLAPFLFLLFAWPYEAISSIYPFLPPLAGVGFWIYLSYRDGTSRFYVLLFTLFFEANHSLPFFSTFITYVLLGVLYDRIKHLFFVKWLLKIGAVCGFFLFYPVMLYMLNEIFNTPVFLPDGWYLFYLFVELLTVSVFL